MIELTEKEIQYYLDHGFDEMQLRTEGMTKEMKKWADEICKQEDGCEGHYELMELV